MICSCNYLYLFDGTTWIMYFLVFLHVHVNIWLFSTLFGNNLILGIYFISGIIRQNKTFVAGSYYPPRYAYVYLFFYLPSNKLIRQMPANHSSKHNIFIFLIYKSCTHLQNLYYEPMSHSLKLENFRCLSISMDSPNTFYSIW